MPRGRKKGEPHYLKSWWDKTKSGDFKPFETKDLRRWQKNCKDELDALIITLLYYTGARPSELCLLKWEDIEIEMEEKLIKVFLRTLKRGLNRTIWFKITDYNDFIIHLKNQHKENELVLQGLRWWDIRNRVYRITNNEICPYFLRHNLYSKMILKGCPLKVLQDHKGAKDERSVSYYTHINRQEVKKIAKELE